MPRPGTNHYCSMCCIRSRCYLYRTGNFKDKETDRVLALQTELAKIGVKLIEKGQVYKLDCSEKFIPESVFINTYDDHRMAMAFAPLALIDPGS